MAADDLVQATMERALRARHRPALNEVQPWLMRILKNLAIDRWRASASQRTCELRDELSHSPEEPGCEPWWWAVTHAQIEDALRSMPERFREILILQLQGVSYADLARRLGLKPATVGSRLFRGRRLLREALESALNRAPEADLPLVDLV